MAEVQIPHEWGMRASQPLDQPQSNLRSANDTVAPYMTTYGRTEGTIPDSGDRAAFRRRIANQRIINCPPASHFKKNHLRILLPDPSEEFLLILRTKKQQNLP